MVGGFILYASSSVYKTPADPTNVVLSYKLFLENILLEKITNLL
jgi:hypothetical protein